MQTSRSILIRPDAITTKAMAIVLALVLFGFATPSQAASNQDELDFIAAQIQRAEADQASALLRQMIEQIERSQGRYAEDLVQPLTLLGDAQSALNQLKAAADSYDRALHLNRINSGLFDPSQTTIVYRQARVAMNQGDLMGARQREEYAFEVQQRHYGSGSTELLPALARLGQFYQRGYNFLAARTLFKRALVILESNDAGDSQAAVPFLQGIAESYLTEGFPPFRYTPSQYDPRMQSGMREQDLFREVGSVNNFPAGERALQQVVKIQQAALDNAQLLSETTDEELAQLSHALHLSLLKLADWHQMFGHIREAKTLYTHLYDQTHQDPERPTMIFAEPKLLYMPKPKDPKIPRGYARDSASGTVEVQFDVLPNGRIRDLQTVQSDPNGLMDFQVRRNLRDAIFRPAVGIDGPVISKAYVHKHDFEYYPEGELDAVASSTIEKPE